MANANSTIQSFIARLADQLGTPLNLEHGVCALYDTDLQQAAVIEVGQHSDSVILHCRLGALHPQQDNLEQLLCMNFDVALLRGCWFALDRGDVRLCIERELNPLDADGFCHLVSGFITQARDTRMELAHLLV
ncbi:type III secretion system chaperone [Pseudomonas zeae]|uniref:type III secretion system chaperone n=1 Tax=Pseudomonas zeae TaxID=2745510 RepID=UPI0039E0DFD5